MALAFRSASTAANGAAPTSLTVTKPTGVVDNDLLLAFVTIAGDKTISGVPTGWTTVGSVTTGTATGDCTQAVYRKIASSEGASYTWTFSGGVDAAAAILAYSGSSTTAPVNVSHSNLMSSSTTTMTSASNTPNVADTITISSFGVNAGLVGDLTFTLPSGTVKRAEADPAGTTTNRAVVAVYDESTPTATATGAKSTTVGNSGKGVAWTVTIAPSGAPAQTVTVQPMTTTGTGTGLADGCMLGWHDDNGYGSTNGLTDMETVLGTKFAVVRIYNQWWPSNSGETASALADGKLPMVSHKPPAVGSSWIGIYKGQYDSALNAMVAHYKGLGSTVIFIFHHEPHDDTTDLKSTPGIYGTAADFVKAYRYIGQAFRNAGADNVLLGYSGVANTWTAVGSPPGSNDKCYPGDDLVDVLCFDEYNSVGVDHNPNPANPGASLTGSWHSFETEYANSVAVAKRLNKPLVFGEIGSNHNITGHDRNTWFTDAAVYIKGNTDARNFLKGFCYYHVDNHGGSGHWWRFAQGEFDDASEGKTGWTSAFSDPYFKNSPISLLTDVPTSTAVAPTGISTGVRFGAAAVTIPSGTRTISSAGAIVSPSYFQSPEQDPGLDFGTASITTDAIQTFGIATGEQFGSLTLTELPSSGWVFIPPVRYNNPPVLASTTGVQRALFKYYNGPPVGSNVYIMNDGTVTERPADLLQIKKVYHGGHVIPITDAEEVVLSRAGYADNITSASGGTAPPPSDPTTGQWGFLTNETATWGSLSTQTWGDLS